MRKRIKGLLMLLLLAGFIKIKAQGMEAQFVPGIQIGTNSVKTNVEKYRFGANLAVMEYDHVGHRMYYNIGLTDGYYRLSSFNRQKRDSDSAKLVKSNGVLFGGRWGMVFGKGEFQRIGFSLNGSWSSLNGLKETSFSRTLTYGTFGAGLVYYRRIGKNLNVMIKGGYEKISGNSKKTVGRLVYVETSIGYELYQKFGVCVQPAFYSRKLNYTGKWAPTGAETAFTGVKATQMVLKIGIAKFLR